MGATQLLAQCIVDTHYEQLPGPVVEAAKVAILDGVANMLGGSTQDVARLIGQYTQALGGTPQSTVIGWGFQTNAPAAAFANGVFGHCLDYEIQGFPPTHGTSSCLPAALALGESQHVSGKTIIEAYVLGWEIQGRLRAASAPASNPAFHPPGMVGPLGAAASGAKVLGLDSQQTLMALGIAASRTGGLTANTGTMVKATHPGNAARMGAEAALLAQMGYTSNAEALEAPNGYAAALFHGQLDWQIVTQNLSTPYRLVDPGFDIKRFPAQVYMQNPIEATLTLRQQHNLTPAMVDHLTIYRQGRGHAGPAPKSGLDGKFSVEYCVAAALLDGRVVIDSFTDARRFAPDMEAMLRKIHVEPVEPAPGVVRVSAHLTDGRTVSADCSGFKGSAAHPMTRAERMEKVWDCISRVLATPEATQMLALIEDLEHVPDITALMQLIGQPTAARQPGRA